MRNDSSPASQPTRYRAAVLDWDELLRWLSGCAPDHLRQGRLKGDLTVTREAFDAAPGEDFQTFENALGETIYRKKLSVYGAVPVELRLLCFEGEGS